ncbi:alpha/beta-hydrolase [Xylariaceae sp. FL0594]|nr:alpha/beta-hydrolase [Xylariaceae sp. FL0594]
MMRHCYFKSPVFWREHRTDKFRGVWIIQDQARRPDLCIYYAHGGGFSMGSSYFYLEFLMSLLDLLRKAGYENPSIFALDYTLVPDGSFPKQLQEAVAGYEHVLSTVGDAGRVCVSGDSAGATIILSLLLHLTEPPHNVRLTGRVGGRQLDKPALAVLVSPWVTLVSDRHRNTKSDYLDRGVLHTYAQEYAGNYTSLDDPLVSPGRCRDVRWWDQACPSHGLYLEYGTEEVFAPEIEELLRFWEGVGIEVTSRRQQGGIHAWSVASLFLSNDSTRRLDGLKNIVRHIRSRM